MQPDFIIKRSFRKGPRFWQKRELRACYRTILEDDGPPVGGLRFVRAAGVNKKRILFDYSPGGQVVNASAKEIKKYIRRLRPEERKELDRIDKQIAELERLRAHTLKSAWSKGHVVTLKEVLEAAEQRDSLP